MNLGEETLPRERWGSEIIGQPADYSETPHPSPHMARTYSGGPSAHGRSPVGYQRKGGGESWGPPETEMLRGAGNVCLPLVPEP